MRKSCVVVYVQNKDDPASITYSSVVSRKIIRFAFPITSLNDLDICACDIGNAYLNENFSENLWTVAEKYFFPSYRGSVIIIDRGLYGLKSSGLAWREMLAEILNSVWYSSTESYLDVWFKNGL